MKRPRRRPRTAGPGATAADERTIEALTVAMAVAPGVYARNRMFAFFANEGVQRAKARAATLRGIVRHLARASSVALELGEPSCVLRYRIPVLQLSRIAELTRVELATLRMLGERTGLTCLPAAEDDRAFVEGALARLLAAGGDSDALARAATSLTSSPPPPPE